MQNEAPEPRGFSFVWLAQSSPAYAFLTKLRAMAKTKRNHTTVAALDLAIYAHEFLRRALVKTACGGDTAIFRLAELRRELRTAVSGPRHSTQNVPDT